MIPLRFFFLLSLLCTAFCICTPSLHLFNASTSRDLFQLCPPSTTIYIKSFKQPRTLNVRAQFCNPAVQSVVFEFNGFPRYRVDRVAPYTLGENTHPAFSAIRRLARKSRNPHLLKATAYDGLKGNGNVLESSQLMLVFVNARTPKQPNGAAPSNMTCTAPNATVTATPTPTPTPTATPSATPFSTPIAVSSPSPPAISLISPSASTFNAPSPLIFTVSGTTFSQTIPDLTLLVNGTAVPTAEITLTADRLTATAELLPGSNNVSLSIFSTGEAILLQFSTVIWVGFETLTVNLVEEDGDPFLARTTITASLSDDPSVQAVIDTNTGTAMFNNLPDRTIIFEARSDNNDVGTAAAIGSQGSISINISGFSEPSAVENNDFSMGTDGWQIPNPASTTLVDHIENVGPEFEPGPGPGPGPEFEFEPEFEPGPVPQRSLSSNSTFRQTLENKDLRLTTRGEGSQTVTRAFRAQFGTTGVRVRYRFITSEVPGGFFGSEYNDFFSISIRSKEAGGNIIESGSMNGLGLAAFNMITGSTAWQQKILPLNHDSDIVEVKITVANVADGAFDSSVEVDFVEELDCNLGEPVEAVFAIGPLDALTARDLANEAFDVAAASGLPGAHNGQRDAFRHCYWSCRMAQEIGSGQAKEVGDLHEICGNNPAAETSMDLGNNAVGRGYGTAGTDCSMRCMNGVSNGDLQTAL